MFKMTVAKRLTLAFTALCGGVLVIAVVSVMSLRTLGEELKDIVDSVAPAEKAVAKLQLESTNLSVLVDKVFQTSDLDSLLNMKSEFAEKRQVVAQLFTDIGQRFGALPGFEQELQALLAMEQATQAMVQEISQNMEAYQRSLVTFQGVEVKKQEIKEYVLQADEITAAFVNSTEDPQALKLAYSAKGVVDRSVASALQISLATNLTTFNEFSEQFKVTSNEYGSLGFKMLKFARSNEVFKESMQAVATFESTLIEKVISAEGISPLINNYLQLRSALSIRITQTQQNLEQNVQDLTNLAEQVSQRATQASVRAEAQGQRAQTFVMLVSGVIILVSVLVGLWVVGSIRKPLTLLRSFIVQVGQGDLTHTFDNYRDDEIGDISRAMNQLVKDLNDVVSGIDRQSALVTKVSSDTGELAEKTQQMTSRQQHDVQESVRSIAEMSESVKEVARTADQTSQAMQAGQQEAELIHQGINNTVDSITELNADMQRATGVIEELDRGVVSIEDILKTIQTIAEQTNLLALNAAIEAARAGEQGRGFAVVADEVRTLANRTQASTEEIREKISTIQSQSRAAVETIGRSQASTNAVTGIAQQAGEQFSGFVTRIQHLNADNMSIAAAAEQQSVTAEQMSQLMLVIGQVSEETSGIADEVVQNIQSLRTVATDLESAVRRFQVK